MQLRRRATQDGSRRGRILSPIADCRLRGSRERARNGRATHAAPSASAGRHRASAELGSRRTRSRDWDRPDDPDRGEPIAPLAGARTAEAIVPAVEADDRIPPSAARRLQTFWHRDVAVALARFGEVATIALEKCARRAPARLDQTEGSVLARIERAPAPPSRGRAGRGSGRSRRRGGRRPRRLRKWRNSGLVPRARRALPSHSDGRPPPRRCAAACVRRQRRAGAMSGLAWWLLRRALRESRRGDGRVS